MFKLIIFLLFPVIMHGQTFKSSATAHIIESYEVEYMERTIEISEDEIIIISQGKEYKDIQTLNVVEKEEKQFGKFGVCSWYYCNTKDIPGSEKLIIVPIQENPKQLSIFEPSKDGASTKEFKIMLD
ncbi:hypothetical protein LB467_13840 [Salegentibacter sp. JZCK2]|uniref:hypothetical protein n=1 Tax=Salegentibacter tibetensis TaxID=2873600 RepID=UPI001CCC4773|nr:hypothetical protein [Salegentibacter tibetensis]MBZ9730772.1 hypothetical protein [Salegentibacter tibetensis]